MNGGEDYELLFTVRQADYDKVKNNPKISVIGYMTDQPQEVVLATKGGNKHPITAQGWNHF
jgi:thiamine-monophosphate kinase